MNKFIKKHNLLKILSEQYIKGWSDNVRFGITEEDIKQKLKISQYELRTLLADLCENKEAQFYNPDSECDGWATTDKGVASFNNKKYKNIHTNNVWNSLKNWTQTIVPILSLIIALIAITKDKILINKQLHELNTKLKHIEKQVTIIQDSTKKEYQNQSYVIDSLKNE